MTLESTIAENKYTGNGSQTVFAFTFPVWQTDEVIVKMDDVLQVHGGTVDVVITNAEAGTGTVTFTVAPASLKEIHLFRAVEQKQESTFPLRAKLNSEELEEQLDRTVAMIQDNTRDLQNNTFNWRSTWSALKNYAIGDAIYWQGSSYRCIAAHINHEPPNATYWQVVALKGDAGGLVWQGAWSAFTSYGVGDGVTYNGSSYIAKATSTNQAPPNATYWDLLAEAGTDGAMTGPGTVVDGDMVQFNGTTGNITKAVSTTGGADKLWGRNAANNLWTFITNHFRGITTPGALKIPVGDGTKYIEVAAPTVNGQTLKYNSAGPNLEWGSGLRATTGGPFNITSSAAGNFDHLLGGKPAFIHAFMRCVTTDGNWAVGDDVQVAGSSSGNTDVTPLSIGWDGTKVYYVWKSTLLHEVVNKTTGTVTNFTEANWKLYITAFAL